MYRMIAFVLAVTTSAGFAQPVEYLFSGIGSGNLGGIEFTDTEFEITLAGELDDITRSEIHDNPLFIDQAATFSVDGIGGGIFLIDLSIVQSSLAERFVLGDFNNGRALAVMNNPEFLDYDLDGPFDPITDFSIEATNQFVNVSTNAGRLSIQEMSQMSFQARVAPAPRTAGILALGGLIVTRRRR